MLAAIETTLNESDENRSVSNELLSTLRKAAFSARRLNRSPVSGFTVLAAVESIDAKVYGGTNIEVSNLSLTKHAEEVAVIAGLLGGEDPGAEWIRTVYVAGATPCGSCRQFLWEWSSEGTVFVFDLIDQESVKSGEPPTTSPGHRSLEVTTFAELLPHPFPKRDGSGKLLGDQSR